MSCPGGLKGGLELWLAASWECIHPLPGKDLSPADSEISLRQTGLGLLCRRVLAIWVCYLLSAYASAVL